MRLLDKRLYTCYLQDVTWPGSRPAAPGAAMYCLCNVMQCVDSFILWGNTWPTLQISHTKWRSPCSYYYFIPSIHLYPTATSEEGPCRSAPAYARPQHPESPGAVTYVVAAPQLRTPRPRHLRSIFLQCHVPLSEAKSSICPPSYRCDLCLFQGLAKTAHSLPRKGRQLSPSPARWSVPGIAGTR